MAAQQVTFTGRLGTDPKLRFSKNGTPIATARLAVNTGKDQPPLWLSAVALGDLAETFAERLSKGSRVIAQGRLRTAEWTDQDGAKRSQLEMLIDDVGESLVGGRPSKAADIDGDDEEF